MSGKNEGVLKISKDQKLNIINLSSGPTGLSMKEAITKVTKRKKWSEIVEVETNEEAEETQVAVEE